MGKVYFGKPGTSLVTFMSAVLFKNVHVIMLQRQIVKLPTYVTNGRLREVKNKIKLQTDISKSGRGRLREVVA